MKDNNIVNINDMIISKNNNAHIYKSLIIHKQ